MDSFILNRFAFYRDIPPTLRAILLIILSTFAFSGMHAIIRYGSQDVHPFEIAFFRNFFGFVVLFPFFIRNSRGVFATKRLPLHALRGGLQVCAMLMFFTAVSLTPLAKISALSFTAPLFATVGAVIFLGEVIRARRIAALVVGFIGAMLIVRPGIVALDTGAILVIASSAIWAMTMLIIKTMSRTESSLTLTAYMGVFLTPLTLVPALFVWTWPTAEQLALFGLMGAFGTIGHVLMAEAFSQADTTAIMPFDFSRLIWASILGYFIFGEVPEFWTWIGGTVIFFSTVYIAYREAHQHRMNSAAQPLSASKPRDS